MSKIRIKANSKLLKDERADLQRTIDSLKDPKAEKEVILLPVESRLKAASLPPLEKPRSRPEPSRAWPSNVSRSFKTQLIQIQV